MPKLLIYIERGVFVFMKKAVRSLADLLLNNQAEASSHQPKYYTEIKEKAPKAVLLACPQLVRMITVDREALFTVESFGATVKTNEATLDYALRRLELPLLIIIGHEHCDALKRALKYERATDEERYLYDSIAAGLENAPKSGKKQVLRHIDAQVADALNRYGDIVKTGKLVVVGVYCDDFGHLQLANYNGLKGREALAYSLPEIDGNLFLK